MRKLTLSMHEKDIRMARRIAREHHTSISAMFSRLVRVMTGKRRDGKGRGGRDARDLPPLTRKALGMIRVPKGKTDRELVEDALVEKHDLER